MTFKMVSMVLALGLVGCDGGGGDDGGGGGTDAAYSNKVMLTCNGTVLLDRTFTTKAECDAHKAQNSYMCSGIALTISC
jgi:hypothetical protein